MVTVEGREVIVVLVLVSTEEMESSAVWMGEVGGEGTMFGSKREEEGGGETAGEGGRAAVSAVAATRGGNWSTGACCFAADNDCADLEPGGRSESSLS